MDRTLHDRSVDENVDTVNPIRVRNPTADGKRSVRIEYRLSKAGRATAALAAPLFAHLNLHALRGRTGGTGPDAG